jgi:hypothetical protein
MARRCSSARRPAKSFALHKPTGHFQARVQAVGPQHFGIVVFDPAKSSSRWLLADFFGNVLIPPTDVAHVAPALHALHDRIQLARQQHQLTDLLVAIERTGQYHRPLQLFFRAHAYDVRLVHPFASHQHRLPADPAYKTDDTDLGGIFRATVQGFGLTDPVWPAEYLHLQLLARQRRDLVGKAAVLQCQIRETLHAAMPGYAERL